MGGAGDRRRDDADLSRERDRGAIGAYPMWLSWAALIVTTHMAYSDLASSGNLRGPAPSGDTAPRRRA
jgi:hypothetical protein